MKEPNFISLSDLNSVRSVVQATYYLWETGFDLKSVLSNRTFYRHRSVLLAFDIDISKPVPKVRV